MTAAPGPGLEPGPEPGQAGYDPNFDWPGRAAGAPMPEPDVDAMRAHLELMFGGDRCMGALDGWVEIAWSDPRTGAVSGAQMFPTDRLDEAAEFAAKKNRVVGCNAYVGMALRKPEAHMGRRAGKDQVWALQSMYADMDRKGAAELCLERTAFCPPSFLVTTGEHPHRRQQAIWLLDEVIRVEGHDSARTMREFEVTLGHMRDVLDGDRAVVDAARVMRLAGSVAWPHKDGRIREMTALVIPGEDGRVPIYPVERVARLFMPVSQGGKAPDIPAGAVEVGTGAAGAVPIDPHARSPITGRLDVQALLNSIGPGNWHNPVLRIIAHMVGMGRRDWEILAVLRPYCDPNHVGERPEDMIRATRAKFGRPEPDEPDFSAEFGPDPGGAAQAGEHIAPKSAAAIVPSALPRRAWLFGKWLTRGIVSMMVGQGGAGKSMLSIHTALAVAADRTWAGQKPRDAGGVWIWNNEDDLTELHRRIAGTAKHMGIDLAGLDGRIFANSGVAGGAGTARRLKVAVRDQSGNIVPSPDVPHIIEFIRANRIRLFSIDPMVSIHDANENDNGEMEKVMDVLVDIAVRADCAVLLVHHTGKPGANIDLAGSQAASRGASSITGAARILLTVTQMSEADARFMMGEQFDEAFRVRCVRVDTGKANNSPPGMDTTFLEKVSVSLGNGSGTHLEDDADQIGGLSVADFSEYKWDAMAREQATHDALRELVATLMAAVPVGGEIDMTTLVSLILARTDKFGRKSMLRQELLLAIPAASQGGIRIGEHLYHVKRSGTHKTATIYVCKREVN